MDTLQPISINTDFEIIRDSLVAKIGPAVFAITDNALIVSVGHSRLILTAEGIILDAPRIDLNPEKTS